MIALIAALWAAEPAPACHVVRGVVVHTPAGPRSDVAVAWSGGVITAVGPGVGAGCEVHELAGGHLTAGLVAAPTAIGLVEVNQEASTHDDGGDGDPIRAGMAVAEGYNPRSGVIPVTRAGGVTVAVIQPSGGFVAGQMGAVRLHGDTWDDAVIRPDVGVRVSLRGLGSTSAAILRLEELFDDAAALSAAGSRAIELSEALSASRQDLRVMARVAGGEIPLVVDVDQASDIEALLRLKERRRFRLIIAGGAEAWMVADALREAKVAVVLRPYVNGAGGFDQLHGREDNAALLVRAGVDVVIGAFDSHNARSLRFVAGNAVRSGLPHEDALRAITEVPARVFGLGPRVGRVEVGAPADLALWTDDPLDTVGRLAALWIHGDAVGLATRQTELVDRWRSTAPVWAEPATP